MAPNTGTMVRFSAGHSAVGIAIGGQHHLRRTQAARGGAQRPIRTALRQRDYPRPAVNVGARGDGGTRQTARIA